MNRRDFLEAAALTAIAAHLPRAEARAAEGGARLMAVNGWMDARDMGLTLEHEHVFADLRPYKVQMEQPLNVDTDEVVAVVLPYLARIKALGCKTLVDCTANGLGRNPSLVKRLSLESGLNMLVPTGNYLAADEIFIPDYVRQLNAAALAKCWIREWEQGIGDSGVRPGFMKLGVNGGPLTDLETKAIEAAAITHHASGLTIGVHVGPWREVEPGYNAAAAFDILKRLEKLKVAPSAFIWFHAQNEPQLSRALRAAESGIFVSFDGFRPGMESQYVSLSKRFKEAGLLHRLLISQDAGWFTAGQPQGGEFAPFDPILTTLRPALLKSGFSPAELNRIFVENPAAAYAVRVRTA